MKKFLAALLVVFSGTISLYADDAGDIKAVIMKDIELAAKGDFLGALARWTADYQEINSRGKFSYAQVKRTFISLDGKHPKEFLQTIYMCKSGSEPTAQEEEQIRTLLRDPSVLKAYPDRAKEMAEQIKSAAAVELKTVQFVSVKVDGMQAVVVLTYKKIPEISWEVRETVSLRKTDGVWRISRRDIDD